MGEEGGLGTDRPKQRLCNECLFPIRRIEMKKNIIFIGLLITVALMFHSSFVLWAQPPSNEMKKPIPAAMKQKVIEFRELMREKRAEGVNVSEAIELDRKSRDAARAGNYEEAGRLIDEAIASLKGASPAQTKTVSVAYPSEMSPPKREDRHKIVQLDVKSVDVTLTKAVPGFQYGKNVSNLKNAFSVNVVKAVGGKVNIDVSSMPIFVEEGVIGGDRRQVSISGVSLNSPFGCSPGPMTQFDREFKNVGVKWIRYSGKTVA